MNMHLVFVSDLHLTPTGFGAVADNGDTERAFCAFVNDVRARMSADGALWRLILLGDTLELLHGAAPAMLRDVIGRVDAIAKGHADLFASLGAAANEGLHVDIVCGNHDAQLAIGSVQQRTLEHLGTPHNVAFHPWIFYEPGVVYAEHGNQYHPINAFRSPLHPSDGNPNTLRQPIGAYIDLETAAARERGARRAPVAGTRVIARAARRFVADTATGSGTVPSEASVARYAAEVDLPPRAIHKLLALRRRWPVELALSGARSAQQALRRRLSSGPAPAYAPAYLHRSAARIDAVLREHASSVPFLVFGHSHVAERARVHVDASAPALLGTGTWTKDGPGRAEVTSRAGRYPFVEIRRLSGVVTADVDVWNGAMARKGGIG